MLNIDGLRAMIFTAVMEEISLVVSTANESFANKNYYSPIKQIRQGKITSNMTYDEYYRFLTEEFRQRKTLLELLKWAQWVLESWTPEMRESIKNYKESSKNYC